MSRSAIPICICAHEGKRHKEEPKGYHKLLDRSRSKALAATPLGSKLYVWLGRLESVCITLSSLDKDPDCLIVLRYVRLRRLRLALPYENCDESQEDPSISYGSDDSRKDV